MKKPQHKRLKILFPLHNKIAIYKLNGTLQALNQ